MIKLNFLKNKKPKKDDDYIQELMKTVKYIGRKISMLDNIQRILEYHETEPIFVELHKKHHAYAELIFQADEEFIEYLEQKKEKLIDELKTIGEIE